ncbi:HAD family hydrolase [Paenibacillus hubeiensis]|uniref:HAD family hydrolase n=1 Tax=Paenibacillus hubeiensis TaxID=3077330 RepID=UPI0031BA08E2
MQDIRAVIFDLDNTILNRTRTFEGFTRSFIESYFSHLETAEPIFARIIELDEDGYKDKGQLFDELLKELPWINLPVHQELMDFYAEHYVGNAVLMEQAQEVVREIRQKYKTALITNGRTDIQYGKIDRLGIRDDFDLIIVSEEAGVKKPDPRIFEMALERLALNPEQCIYIGDHPANDVQGAADAGLHPIWMKVNQPWRDDLTVKPVHVIEHLSELQKLL